MTALIGRRTFIRRASLTLTAATLSCTPLRAQPAALRPRRIGYLSGNRSVSIAPHIEIVLRTLGGLGYVAGRDVAVEPRSSEGRDEDLPDLAGALVALPVDVIMAEASPAALAAQQATQRIPIVFGYVNDPVGQLLVASLAHPGANITGVTTRSGTLSGKRLELLKAVVPDLTEIAVIWNSVNLGQALVLRDTEAAARQLGIRTRTYGVPGAEAPEFDSHLADIRARRPGAAVLLANLSSYSARFAAFGIAERLPHILSAGEDVETSGALMGLGPDYIAQNERAALLVDKILKGRRPADLPVEEPSERLIVVNLVTARRLGIAFPPDVLKQATKVVQ